jgi:hypothetical protein
MALSETQKRRRKGRAILFIASFMGLLSVYAALMGTLLFTAARA